MQIGLIILIHGLPPAVRERDVAWGSNPPFELASIEPQLRSIGPVWAFPWGRETGPIATRRLLTTGNFGKTLANRFNDELQDRIRGFGVDEKLLVVAYSLGALIFYRWVSDPEANPHHKARVALGVTIAAPYQCETGSWDIEPLEGDEKRAIKDVREPRIEPADVLRNLPNNTLKILLAEEDGTILPYDSSFRKDLFPVRLRHLEEDLSALRLRLHRFRPVREVRIKGTCHRDICDDQKTLEYIQGFCDSLGEG